MGFTLLQALWLEKDSGDQRGVPLFGFISATECIWVLRERCVPFLLTSPIDRTGKSAQGLLGRNYRMQRCLLSFIQVQHSRAMTQPNHAHSSRRREGTV